MKIYNIFFISFLFISIILSLILYFNRPKNVNIKHKISRNKRMINSIEEIEFSNFVMKNQPKYYDCIGDNFFGCIYNNKGIKTGSYSTPPVNYTAPFPIKYNILIDSKFKCGNSDLIVGVVGAPNIFLSRWVYRQILNKYSNIQYYFFMGLSDNNTINERVKNESNIYHDIIQFDYKSGYYNTTIQFVAVIRWIKSNCNNYKYSVYIQPDVYLNFTYYMNKFNNDTIKPVISFLVNYNVPQRDPHSIWYLSKELYPQDEFPWYPLGPCIFFSEKTIRLIVNASYYERRVIFIDDVYIGLLLNDTGLSHEQYSVYNDIVIYCQADLTRKPIDKFWIHGLNPDLLFFMYNQTYYNIVL